jgi:hypothetical protein
MDISKFMGLSLSFQIIRAQEKSFAPDELEDGLLGNGIIEEQ